MTRGCTDNDAVRRAASAERSACVRWKVGTVAGRRAFDLAGEKIALELAIHEETPGRWSGRVRVASERDDPRTIDERPVEVRWQADDELSLLHIDAPGFLRATIDTGNGVPRLLYARSGVLGELGLEGGRYEPEGTDLHARD